VFAGIHPVDGGRGKLFAPQSITLSSSRELPAHLFRIDGDARSGLLIQGRSGFFLVKVLFCKKAGASKGAPA
jgi:hypothetical protein